jgi:hypothetical protein
MSNSSNDVIEAVQRCVIKDNDDGRELLCDVDSDHWSEAVEKPVDEVTFQHTGDSDESETVLGVEDRVEEVLEERGLV